MLEHHPVDLSVTRPTRYSAAQILLRLVLFVLLGTVGASFGALLLLLYLALPTYAAIVLAREPSRVFLEREGPNLTRVLRWVVSAIAYFALVTDRFPTSAPIQDVDVEIRTSGQPTTGTALWRLITGLPSALALCVLLLVSGVVWLLALIGVLVRESYWTPLFDFQVGVLRWTLRLLAYQASLVDAYPPFSVSAGEHPQTPAESGQ